MVITYAQRRVVVRLLLLALAVGGVFVVLRIFDGDEQRYDYVATWDRPEVRGATVTLSYDGGACDDHAFTRVDESAAHVTITIYVAERHHEDCNAMAYARTIDVHLAAPLGHRELVDGAGG